MTGKPSSTGTIVVAVIGVLGTISAALIANWDKLSGARTAVPVNTIQAPKEATTAQPASEGVVTDQGMDAAAPINLAGKWTDAAGYEYMFEPGDGYSFKRYKNGEQVGWGAGSLTGRSFTYVDRGADFGNCRGEVSADLKEMNSICTVGTNQFSLKLVRRTTVTL